LHLAIDLGAGSGRAILGRFVADGLRTREVHRFVYPPRPEAGHLRWPMAQITAGIEAGLAAGRAAAAADGPGLRSVGVDGWGVDYGIVDGAGRLLEAPVCYRDPARTAHMEDVLERVPRADLYARTGIQFLPFNTVYQLWDHVREGLPRGAARLLMVPDLLHQFLAGVAVNEYTNASTTQLLDARRRDWDDALFERLSLPRSLVETPVEPGTVLGPLRPDLGQALDVVAPATHDTASAVAGTPLRPGWAYVSSGTWSLVGVERRAPVLGKDACRASFTNEGGVYGTVRFLKNVMGLWILEGCRRDWDKGAGAPGLSSLVEAASRLESPAGLVFPDDPRFFNPESMTAAVAEALRETGQAVPDDPARLARVVLDSLALRYASVLETIERLTGEAVLGIHVVGGGSRNAYLNQATADAAGRPVLAGPAEATALGNLALQAIATGAIGSLSEARAAIERSHPPRLFEPRPGGLGRDARERYARLERAAAPPS
jgi:rhamnulokinase